MADIIAGIIAAGLAIGLLRYLDKLDGAD